MKVTMRDDEAPHQIRINFEMGGQRIAVSCSCGVKHFSDKVVHAGAAIAAQRDHEREIANGPQE